MAAIGNIVGIKGQAFVVDVKGNKHVLKLGEVIQAGDVIQTPAGSSVYMHLTNGRIIEVTPEQSVKITTDLAANAIPAFDENAVGQTTVQTILQAINDGKDISQVIDDTAAGLTGGDSNDSHSALLLDRIVETTTGNTFNVDGAANGPLGATQTPFYNRNYTSALSLTAALDPASDSGTKGDGITNVQNPSIIGTGVAGDKISVTMPGTGEVLTTTVAANNTWTVTPTTPLADGTKGVAQVVETDGLGNSATASVPLTIDRTATPAPTVTILTDVNQDHYLSSSELKSASTANVEIGIPTGALVGDTLTVTDNSGNKQTFVLTQAEITASKVETTAPVPAEGQELVVTATITDQAGNVSQPGTASAIVDTAAPDAPVITSAYDDVAPVTGVVANNGYTNDTTPTISGTAEKGSTVTVYDTVGGHQTVIGTAVADATTGIWTLTPTTPLANGTTNAFTATSTDAAGNVSVPSNIYSLTIDTAAPDAPVITSAYDDVAPVTGVVANNGYTNDTTPTISGTAEKGSTVTVYDTVGGHQTVIGTAVADATTGIWTLTPATPLANGTTNAFTATSTDAAGNVSVPSNIYSLTIDTAAPDAPVITSAYDDVAPVTGVVANNGYTNDTTPTISGTAEKGSTVTVYDTVGGHQTVIGTAVADATTGIWTLTPTTPLANGTTNAFTATSTDAAGNVSVPSNIYSLTIDTAAPDAPVITSAYDDVAPVTGVVANNGYTNDTTPTISGTAEKGSTVTVYDTVGGHQTVIGTAVADATTGIWTLTPATPLANGTTNAFTATSTDAAGNVSVPSNIYSLTIDTAAPDAPVITSAYDDVAPVTGVVANNGYTNDTTPTISGTAEKGSTVTVYDTVGGHQTVIGTAVADATTGIWTLTPTTPLANGTTNAFTATSTDAAGNVSVPSNIYSLTIDTAAPDAPVITSAYDDVAPVTGVVANNGYTNDTTPTISGTAEKGSTVTVYDTVGGHQTVIGTAVADATTGIWTLTPATPLANGTTNAFTATSTDAAGNVSVPSNIYSLTIDTTAPDAPVVGFQPSGLISNYYGINDSLISSNAQPLNEVLKDITNSSPTATFIANALSFNPGDNLFNNNLGTSGNLAAFLGGNATNLTLSNSYGSTTQAAISLNGSFTMGPGTYTFRVTADDGYQILVDGKPLVTDNSNHESITTNYSVTLAADAGNLHTIQILYWDQGGFATFGISVAAAGSSNFEALNVNPSNTLTATVTLDAADQADVTNGGSVHITSSNGIDTTLHLNSAGALVDASGTPYAYQNGVIYVPTNATRSDGVTITATVSDVAGNVSNPGSAHITQVTAPDAPVVGFQTSGIVSSYYGINDSLISSNSQPLNEVLKDIANSSPTATFVANALSFNPGNNLFNNNLGTAGNLATFLGANETNLTLNNNYGSTTQAVLSLNGSFTLAAGIYTFRVTADDGYQILVDGKPLVTDNSNHPVQTTDYSVTLGADAGNLHTIQIVYWDQGGAATFGVSVAPAGSSNFQVLNVNPPNTLTATVTLDAADQTDVTNGGSVHLTSSNGLDTTLHLNSSGVLVDASGHAYQYQQGVIYVPTGASPNTVLTVSSSVTDVHGNSSAVATTILGTGANDVLAADNGNDVIIGGAGNDTLNAGIGADVFKWSFGDAGKPGAAAVDVINGFKTADGTQGGDVLDLRDLLVGENSNNLQNYLHFEQSGSNTIVHISSTGAFSGSNTVGAPTSAISGAEDQKIVLAGVNLVGSNTTDVQVINALLTQHKLVTDH